MLKKGLLVKNLLSEIWKTRTRYLSIFAISALGVAFFAGIRATSPDMKDAGDALFNASNLSDITVMSTAGLTPDVHAHVHIYLTYQTVPCKRTRIQASFVNHT